MHFMHKTNINSDENTVHITRTKSVKYLQTIFLSSN